jgi:hypothetical protein
MFGRSTGLQVGLEAVDSLVEPAHQRFELLQRVSPHWPG